ncbi:unnamed protein product [Vitrella brassicaformis CCMP3155]|uniref:Chalcone isomerase domain-containing protein n=1 Tax=Vitrella brassicaformis (strain CCMP3155) TaxID=1169540 RepID=A0A0G4H2I2_VITBC|nr:unnamed protein product [Vitrella brassicaformis CCMP3155]|mmetsp:Transcript_2657/g.6022  ORF Transcript_2657/g.6022 Transcript_2657/m.6022 type:complete len:304 (-) Transcript_2657:799-1710(-)|eukprot:CEM37684.1 unnamed protein product [Vitrella brassicaformis CCMP3155]
MSAASKGAVSVAVGAASALTLLHTSSPSLSRSPAPSCRRVSHCEASSRPSDAPPVINLPQSTTKREEVLGVEFPVQLPVLTGPWAMPHLHQYISSAPRCMQNACWFPPARAYSLGLYLDQGLLNSYMDTGQTEPGLLFDDSVDKTFRFVFVSEKDPRHIRDGFARALRNALPLEETYDYVYDAGLREVNDFISHIRPFRMKSGSVLIVTCIAFPKPGRTVILYSDQPDVPPHFVGQVEGVGLRLAFHHLYVQRDKRGQAKYPAITGKFEKDLKDMLEANKAGHQQEGDQSTADKGREGGKEGK